MKKSSAIWFKVRIIFISCLLFFCFIILTGRIFQLQVLNKKDLYQQADRQHRIKIPLVPKRGTIYERNGNEIAVSIEVDSVYADCRKVVDPEKTAHDLAPLLRINREELKRKLTDPKSFEWIQRKISPKEVAEIKSLNPSGIYFSRENQRFYPNGPLAAHVIGFVGLDSRGLEGVEYQYDALLNGKHQVWTVARDAYGREIAMGETPFEKEEHHRNILLTIDKHIQHVVEKELNQSVQKWGARGGFVIAMEPSSGKVLAMASSPSFNPNQFMQYRSRNLRNQAISDTFEPGSLFKAILAAAALDQKVVQPSDSFFCENGSYKVYDRTLHDHAKYGWLSFQQIIKFSSNIGASKVGEKVGKDRFYRYICAFGFGEKTGIGLSGEAKGIVHHPRYWPPVVLDTISFGQGISVTGIQLITALCAIANGGSLMKPYVVEKITDAKGEIVQSFEPQVVRRVISEETAKKVIAILRTTTEKEGTGEGAVPLGYEVGGKTGTAQKIDPILGGYSEDRFISGFMGFVPPDNPRIALLGVIDEPRGSIYGGVVAAPLFKAIMEKILPYLNVLPKGTMVVRNESVSNPQPDLSKTEPFIEKDDLEKTFVRVLMPDLTGLSMRNALSRIEGKGLIIKVSGNGKVVEQTPRPGTLIEKGDICYLIFQSSS